MQPLPSDHGGAERLEKDMSLAVTIFSNLAATMLLLGLGCWREMSNWEGCQGCWMCCCQAKEPNIVEWISHGQQGLDSLNDFYCHVEIMVITSGIMRSISEIVMAPGISEYLTVGVRQMCHWREIPRELPLRIQLRIYSFLAPASHHLPSPNITYHIQS